MQRTNPMSLDRFKVLFCAVTDVKIEPVQGKTGSLFLHEKVSSLLCEDRSSRDAVAQIITLDDGDLLGG